MSAKSGLEYNKVYKVDYHLCITYNDLHKVITNMRIMYSQLKGVLPTNYLVDEYVASLCGG